MKQEATRRGITVPLSLAGCMERAGSEKQAITTWASDLRVVHLHTLGDPATTGCDGGPVIFGMDWNTIGVEPGDWARLGPAQLFRLDAHGDDAWVREVDAWWSGQDIAVVDLKGDGTHHVLVNGPGASGDGSWRLTARGGVAQRFLPLDPWKMLRGPVTADLRDDGSHRLIAAAEPMDPNARHGAVLVYDLGY